MKGPFSLWSVFGLTLFIDLFTLSLFYFKDKKVDNINREVSVMIPVHNETEKEVDRTINALFEESYKLKNIFVVYDKQSKIKKLNNEKIIYVDSPYSSKAKKINYIAKHYDVGEILYVRDCRVKGTKNCIKKMVKYFSDEKIAAVTSYGRVTIPKSSFSRLYYYGKDWINEIGRFRKKAQELRNSLFVVCGASTMYRTSVLKEYPIPALTKTEDTHYTWDLQLKGYKVAVADDARVTAPDVDGENVLGLKNQLKQSYRWSSGTIQCLYTEGKNFGKNKALSLSTIVPGYIEALMYSIPLVLLPIIFLLNFHLGLGFILGDTFFSLLSTAILLPNKFTKTLKHYPEILIYKYLNSAVFLYSVITTSFEKVLSKNKWENEWVSFT